MAITFEDMVGTAQNYRREIRMPDMRNIVVPRMTSPEKSKAYAPELVPKLVKLLTKPLTDEEKSGGVLSEEKHERIAVRGNWDVCQEYFQGDVYWTSLFYRNPPSFLTTGAPVVLPTEEKVEWMLTGTSHKPGEIMGPLPVPADQKEFTVETVAINAAMAGCKPGELQGSLSEKTCSQAPQGEGSTAIPQGSRVKRPQAPSPRKG